ncbi:MAG: translation initiation factor IF-5A [Nanoarchaeota archaeon]|nr:translation initiation factor IF-5A [Nanoarchaeota archaeon]
MEGDKKVVTAGSLKVGSYVILDGKACVVKSLQVSKTGKHGHAKCRIEAICLTDGQKIIQVFPGTDKVDVPIIEKKTAQILSVVGDVANVMDLESYETFDLKIPQELKDKIVEGGQVIYWIVIGERIMKQSK